MLLSGDDNIINKESLLLGGVPWGWQGGLGVVCGGVSDCRGCSVVQSPGVSDAQWCVVALPTSRY
jgi:hypothetical protein